MKEKPIIFSTPSEQSVVSTIPCCLCGGEVIDSRATLLGLMPDFGGPIADQMAKAAGRITNTLSRYKEAANAE